MTVIEKDIFFKKYTIDNDENEVVGVSVMMAIKQVDANKEEWRIEQMNSSAFQALVLDGNFE